jgi:hypothetical protein
MRQVYTAALRTVLVSLFLYSLAAAQSERVKIDVEKASYEVGDTILMKVANSNDQEIVSEDHKSSCSIVNMEKQEDKEWALAGFPCLLRNLTREIKIGPHQDILVKLATINDSSKVTSLKPGTYRIKLDYFFENSPNEPITAYSDSFQITADANSTLSSCPLPVPLLKNEPRAPGYIVFYKFAIIFRLGKKPEEITQLLMTKYNFTPGQVFHNLPDLFSGFFAELSEETLAEIRCESAVKLVEQNADGKVEELTRRNASRVISTGQGVPAVITEPLPKYTPKGSGEGVPAGITGPLPNTKPQN